MKVPKRIEQRITRIANPKSTAAPCLIFIEQVVETDFDAPEHLGEYRATIALWDGKPGTGDKYPRKYIYKPTEAEAIKATEQFIDSSPENKAFSPVIMLNNLTPKE